ncbi:hypothetical protein EGT49_12275 [Companilactobacillus suantsaicola]|uniref:Surface layer protein A domain-containing protein n=1 Tax=Companilactobacillus suantsaicola TaxID=2487723 RepID=A0A4Z0JE73_9LACO|nr:hypothetical protein [Companilactobacillus suantsaicola]TGD20925.1 hypothetical protein EGT49_12275 [Companilactobacillus suantsaicola]
MIRKFSSNGIFATQGNSIDLYVISGNTFTPNGSVLSPNTSWQYQEYAYDESLKKKFFKVDNTEWAAFDKPGQNASTTLDNSDGNFQIKIDRDFDYSAAKLVLHPVVVYHKDKAATNAYPTDGSRFLVDGAIEMYDTEDNNGYVTSAYNTGFKVDNTDYYCSQDVFPDAKLTSSTGSIYGDHVTPISKIININSVAPDYFDLNGNAVTGVHYNLGHQILSDAIYTTNNRTGYKIGDNQFININDATGTSLMSGSFYPSNKGVD